jgi:hypothetical protein
MYFLKEITFLKKSNQKTFAPLGHGLFHRQGLIPIDFGAGSTNLPRHAREGEHPRLFKTDCGEKVVDGRLRGHDGNGQWIKAHADLLTKNCLLIST